MSSMQNNAQQAPPICYACGASTNDFRLVNGFQIVSCPSCGLKFVRDEVSLESLKKFYSDEYFGTRTDEVVGYSTYVKDETIHRRNARAILALARKHVQLEGARVMDVGCAYGFFLDEARAAAGEKGAAVGFEFNANAADYARRVLKLDVREQAFESADPSLGSFDLIVSIATIEHFINPLKITKKVAGYLKPGGCFIITTIDTEGKLPFYSLKPPEHLHYFSNRSLARMYAAAGLEIASSKTYFARYGVADLFFRMGAFSGLRIFHAIGRLLNKCFPNLAVCIPTNEMIVVARNRQGLCSDKA